MRFKRIDNITAVKATPEKGGGDDDDNNKEEGSVVEVGSSAV
jgi:hypothetical protein